MNKYLEKIAEQSKKVNNVHDALVGGAAGISGLALGSTAGGVAAKPFVSKAMSAVRGDDEVTREHVQKFIDHYKLHGAEVNALHFEDLKGVNHTERFVTKDARHMGPHAVPKWTVDIFAKAEGRKDIPAGGPGYVHSNSRSGSIMMHELGHLRNDQKYHLAKARSAARIGQIGTIGMMTSREHSDDAWKLQAALEAPQLADELGTNYRAHKFINKYVGHAPKSKVALIGSAGAYTALSAGKVGGVYLAGKWLKKHRGNHDASE